jgi:hypothetical protein
MLPMFVYTTIACASNFAMDFDRDMTPLLRGNKSTIQTEKCELRYDKEMKWAQGYVKTTIKAQNTLCGDWVDACYDEFAENVNVEAFIEIKKCRVNFIDVRTSFASGLYFAPDEMKQTMQNNFKYQILLAIQQDPKFQLACSEKVIY